MDPTIAAIALPSWLADMALPRAMDHADEDRMRWAIELAERNVAEKTGGPFAAIIVEEMSGECIAAGVNLVVATGLSLAHAEVVAIMLAQLRAKTYDLAGDAGRRYSLYATGQPCIMCFGSLWWSGVTKLACAARAEDIEQLTHFREGPLPERWPQLLAQRTELPAIAVAQDVLRGEACAVLRSYMAGGHPIYNPGSSVGD